MIEPQTESKQSTVYILLIMLIVGLQGYGQTWADTLDNYARLSYLPASRYMWTWQDAALLNTMVKEYDASPADKKLVYLEYVKKAMNKTYIMANGHTPNDVASGLGLAFLYKETKDKKYLIRAEKVYADYLKIRRTDEGGVSHLSLWTELWDDTVFMIGEYLLAMYQATGDEKYLEEFAKQVRIHRSKLQDKQTGLWYHGWDSDNKDHCMFCSQAHWPDRTTRLSHEKWGRGNGWIVVTLSDALDVIPASSPMWSEMAGYLKEMIVHLPEWQDKKTGHWYQLPERHDDPDNYIESSCTAMFGYGIAKALRHKVVSDTIYDHSIRMAYEGLRRYSMVPIGDMYLTLTNVCTGTCIGDKNYYFKRARQKGKPYGVGMSIQFDLAYRKRQAQR